MKNKKPIKITWPSFIIVLILAGLLTYAMVDATITTPRIEDKVENVSIKFDSLSIFLDAKIPQLEEAVKDHEEQLQRQNVQLQRINELTESLKEE